MKQTPGYFVLITSFMPGTASLHTAFPVSPGGLLGLPGASLLPPRVWGVEPHLRVTIRGCQQEPCQIRIMS